MTWTPKPGDRVRDKHPAAKLHFMGTVQQFAFTPTCFSVVWDNGHGHGSRRPNEVEYLPPAEPVSPPTTPSEQAIFGEKPGDIAYMVEALLPYAQSANEEDLTPREIADRCAHFMSSFDPTGTPAEPVAREAWRALRDSEGCVQCDEGNPFLFAIQVSTNGGPFHWEYFVDAVVWDSETAPDWSSGEHGWDICDEIQFRELPPAPVEKASKL